jgi:hypothetical protein
MRCAAQSAEISSHFVPQLHHLPGFREEAVAADVEQEALVALGPADAADVALVHLDDGRRYCFLGEKVRGGQAGGTGADHEDITVHGMPAPLMRAPSAGESPGVRAGRHLGGYVLRTACAAAGARGGSDFANQCLAGAPDRGGARSTACVTA